MQLKPANVKRTNGLSSDIFRATVALLMPLGIRLVSLQFCFKKQWRKMERQQDVYDVVAGLVSSSRASKFPCTEQRSDVTPFLDTGYRIRIL